MQGHKVRLKQHECQSVEVVDVRTTYFHMIVLNEERQLRTIRLNMLQQGLVNRCRGGVTGATLPRLLDALHRYPRYGFDIGNREGLQDLDGNRPVVLRLGLF